MVLTNAQRQKAYREKLKAIARGDMIGEQIQEALMKAIEALWSSSVRDNSEGWESLADLQTYCAANPKDFESYIRDQSGYLDELTDGEAASIKTAVEIFDAVALRK